MLIYIQWRLYLHFMLLTKIIICFSFLFLSVFFLTLFCFRLLFPSKRHRSRPPPDRIASAVRLDCVCRSIGLRTGADDFAKELL